MLHRDSQHRLSQHLLGRKIGGPGNFAQHGLQFARCRDELLKIVAEKFQCHVGPHAEKRCVTQMIVPRPFGERDLDDGLRFQPHDRVHVLGGDAFAPVPARRFRIGQIREGTPLLP